MKSATRLLRSTAFLAALAFAGGPAPFAAVDLVGDDTDLFTTNPNIPSQIPRVLIILDNTSNWASQAQNWPAPTAQELADCPYRTAKENQQGDAEVCALYKLLTKKDASGNFAVNEQVAVGLMMYEDQQTAGGYIRFPILPMTGDETTGNRAAFLNILRNINTNNPGDKGPSSGKSENIMNDAFRYFNSLVTKTGVAVGKPGGPPSPQAHVGGYSSSLMTNFSLSKADLNACGYDYILFVGNGPPSTGDITPDLPTAAALLNDSSVTPNTTAINNSGVNPDVWSRFMYQYGTKISNGVYKHITTYTINVCKDQCTQNIGWTNWDSTLQSMATVSGGSKYKATDAVAISTAFEDVFAKIQAVNSVFAATTLPVSINVRGTNLNQVYIGVFRPDANQSPRWFGNLKQYQLGRVCTDAEKAANGGICPATASLQLVDATCTNPAACSSTNAAVNLNTGFIFNTARSLWTSSSTFWSFRAPYPPTDVGGASDSPDGDLVEKGGAAQRIRTLYATPDSTGQVRNIYTCTGSCTAGSSLSGFPFNEGNADITATVLGTLSTLTVNTLTATGTTATATINGGHSFTAGQQVVIQGATPNLYNAPTTAPVSVLASPAPTATQFSYVLGTAPDTTNAYVTLPGFALTPGTDLVTVTGATPGGYNVTNASIASVVGNANQFSYPLGAAVTSAASGFTVTGVRRVSAGNMVWSSATNLVTVTLANHGYTGGNVVVTGATPTDFNVPNASGSGAITVVNANTFTFPLSTVPAGGTTTTALATSAAAHGFSTGDSVVVTGASGNFNTAATGSSATVTDATNFSYTTSGTVSGTATGTISVQKRIAADVHSYPVTAASVGTGANQDKITLTRGAGSTLVAGQVARTLQVGDLIAVRGVTCVPQGGGAARICSTTTSNPPAAGDAVYTRVVTAVTATTVTYSAGGNLSSAAITAGADGTEVYWTGASLSAAQSLTTVTAGPTTVTATGTIFASQTGDLTSKITSITSQGVATGSITAALATASDPNERLKLIRWVRGHDNVTGSDENGTTSGASLSSTCDDTTPGTCDIRASHHGDVLHSRPAVVNYNRFGDDNDVYVFYGANDGMFHAIKGGQEANVGGNEQWSFVAPEFFSKLKRLRDQAPKISSLTPKDYFFDGSIATYVRDANKDGKIDGPAGCTGTACDKVYLFITMRRGGRMIYALDVTNPTDPKLLWKKGCREATGSGTTVGTGNCDVGFGEMGQTWGQPSLGYLRKWPTTLALIVGAGYDQPVEDFQPCMVTAWSSTSVTAKTGITPPTDMNTTTCPPAGGTSTTKNRTMGRGVYILNAETGAILWQAAPQSNPGSNDFTNKVSVAGMDYAIVGDIAALRNASNTANRADDFGNESVPIGYFDRIYAVDTGGNVWRIDVADTSGAAGAIPSYPVSHLASIASTSGTPASLNYRKFMSQTDVVYSGTHDAVLVGSGDREHVWDKVVTNRFYMFKDPNTGTLTSPLTGPTYPLTESSLYDTTTNDLTQLAAKSGWMRPLSNVGEKVIAPATTAAGTVIFNTHQPVQDTITGQTSVDQCTVLGTARQYGINFQNATSANIYGNLPPGMVSSDGAVATFAGGGFLPQPVPAVICINGVCSQTVISGVQTTDPGGLKLQSRLRTYWYRKTD